MSDALKRALRTFVQAFIGTLLASQVLQGIVETGEIASGDVIQRALVSATAAGLIGLLSWAQNALEEATGKNLLPK